jgi:hypothetical protein
MTRSRQLELQKVVRESDTRMPYVPSVRDFQKLVVTLVPVEKIIHRQIVRAD